MTQDDEQYKMLADIKGVLGYLTGKVEGIDKHLETQNGAIKTLSEKTARHDVVLGKFGMIISIAIVAVNVGVQSVIQFFWKK